MIEKIGLSNFSDRIKSGKTHAIKVDKAWGHEMHIVNTPEYCMKKLVFSKKNAKFSMHFHKDKKETWYIEEGKIRVDFIFTDTAEKGWAELEQGSVWTNNQLFPHQITCLSDKAVITEVSTHDKQEDNYRIEAGDSQNGQKQ